MPKHGLTFYCDSKRHLICLPYNTENLHKMASILGIKRCWFHNSDKPHYDIPLRRVREIRAQCEFITAKQLLSIINNALAER